MNFGAPLRVLAIAAVSVAGLIGLVVHESVARDAGTEVLLAMQPVDPRALLSGHYIDISLNETISPAVATPQSTPCPPGIVALDASLPFGAHPDRRWIALAAAGGHHVPVGAADTQAAARRYAPLVVRGTASCRQIAADEPGALAGPTSVSLDLGVRRFYASQSESERIAALVNRQNLPGGTPVFAIVSVGGDGVARLKGLLVDGKRLELSLF